jgi:hypothetical protein
LTRIAVALERIAGGDSTQLAREAMAAMADVAKTAISPPVVTGAAASTVSQAPVMAMFDADDPADPNEVWLGADFIRDQSGIYDAAIDAPFGLPGIKAEV